VPHAEHDATWSVDGSLGFKDVAVNVGQDEKKLTGKVTGKASRAEAGLEIQAKCNLDKLQVGPRTITDMHGTIAKAPASQVIQVKDFSGKAYGGMIAGAAQIKLTDPVEYGVRLDVEGLDMAELVNAGLPEAKKNKLAGKVSGRVQYSFKPRSEPSQQAAGQLWVTQAKIIKLPVMLDLLHVLVFSLPGESAFSEGSLTYTLKGKKLVLSEIHFTGSGLSILGSGTLDLATEKLNLTFLTASDRLPRIAFLNDLLNEISSQVTEVRVTGTIQKPKMDTVPFHSVRDVIDTLLNPGKNPEEKE
jgi:phosphohistidine swiveling domain-containing protein